MPVTDVLFGGASLARAFLTPSFSVDVVAITGSGFAPMFSGARPLQASVYELADLMEHPLETGAVITDHIVFKPIEIEMPLLCMGDEVYRSTYEAIRSAYLSGEILTVTTRTGSYPSMVISDLPHDETAEEYDGISIRLRLREARFVSPKSGLSSKQVKNANQSSTAARGNQQTAARSNPAATSTYGKSGAGSTSSKGSTLYQWYNAYNGGS